MVVMMVPLMVLTEAHLIVLKMVQIMVQHLEDAMVHQTANVKVTKVDH